MQPLLCPAHRPAHHKVHSLQKFIADRGEEAKLIVSQRLGLDYAQVDALWDEFNFQLGLDEKIILTLENEAKWAIVNGLTDAKEIPNYLDYLI